MCAKKNEAAAVNDGKQTAVVVRQQETDAPLLPVSDMERLHRFRPDAVNWILDKSTEEMNWRREQVQLSNKRIFIERIVGQILGFLVGLSGIIGGIVAISMGASTAGCTIATVSIGTLAVAYVTGKNKH
jgi:hypothetical protein